MMQKSVNNSLLVFLFLTLGKISFAQENMFRSDIKQITIHLSVKQPDPYKRPYIYKDEPSVIRKTNPIGILFGGSLFVYQNVLSKHISADCLFTPSCSEFSKEAISKTGIITGTLLTIDRVNRCNRIAAIDLKHYSTDPKTKRYPDPVSRHIKTSPDNGE
jgi:uncharacterized protein